MQVIDLSVNDLAEAPWNPNQQDPAMMVRLTESVSRYGLVQNLVVRPLSNGTYEVLSGNQRIQVMRNQGHEYIPCVVVEMDDARARLLAQALNRIHGEDDLGLRAELMREVLDNLHKKKSCPYSPRPPRALHPFAPWGRRTWPGIFSPGNRPRKPD